MGTTTEDAVMRDVKDVQDLDTDRDYKENDYNADPSNEPSNNYTNGRLDEDYNDNNENIDNNDNSNHPTTNGYHGNEVNEVNNNNNNNNNGIPNGHGDDLAFKENFGNEPEDELQFGSGREVMKDYGNESPRYLENIQRGRASKFFINGDKFFPAKKIVYNPKHFKDFETYLDFLTNKLEPRFGAVRKIHTPNQGHRVTHLKDIQPEVGYVVSGVEKFKRFSYDQITPSERKRAPKFNYDASPVYHSRQYQSSGRINKTETHSILIKVWANGQDLKGPRRVLLSPKVVPFNMENVMGSVDEMLAEDCQGTVMKLYMMNGIKVGDVDQIVQNGEYVALRKNEKFKRARYTENGFKNLSTSPRMDRKFLAPLGSRNSTNNSSPEYSNASSSTGVNGGPRRRGRPAREEDAVFPAKPVKHTRSSEKTRQVDLDKDEGGVFKAKQANRTTKGAREIQDNRQTRTELPVDQRVAREVEEEITNNQRQPPPPAQQQRGGGAAPPAKPNSRRPPPASDPRATNGRSPPDGGGQGGVQAKSNSRRAPPDDRQRELKEQRERDAEARRQKEENKRAEAARKDTEKKRQEKEKVDQELVRKEREQKAKEELKREQEELERERIQQQQQQQQQQQERPKSNISLVEDLKEDLAAAKIQAGFRGHQTRKELNKQKEEAKSFFQPQSPRQPSPKQPSPRQQQQPSPKQETVMSMMEEDLAAAKIQAGFRGHQTRKAIKQGKEETKKIIERSEQNVQNIQDDFEARLHEEKATKTSMMEEDLAAAKIQAGFRGHQTRSALKAQKAAVLAPPSPKREEPKQTPRAPPPKREETYDSLAGEHDAAAKIQAGFRGMKTRQEIKAKKNETHK